MEKIRLGFAMCGSFCTYSKVISELRTLVNEYDIQPIMSESGYSTDTRFGAAKDFVAAVETVCGKPIIKSIAEAEPIGPAASFDALVVAPCTGNTLAKLTAGITNTSVTMACKAHLRNGRPVILAISTNDGLGASAKNVGSLLERKSIYFVPFYQDDPVAKPNSLTADLSKLRDTIESALKGKQYQPVLTAVK